MIDQYDPWFVKDELTALECEPVETTRTVVTTSTSFGTSEGWNRSKSQSLTKGEVHVDAEQFGMADGHATAESHGHVSGHQLALGPGESLSPDGTILHGSQFESDVAGTSQIESHGDYASYGYSDGWSRSRTRGTQAGESGSSNRATTIGVSFVPFHSYVKRRVVSSRTFLSQEEFMTLKLQQIKELPDAHFVLKVPHHRAVFVRAPWVTTPTIGERRRRQHLARVYQQPCYATPRQIEDEEKHRQARLLEAAQPQVIIDSETPRPRRRAPRRRLPQEAELHPRDREE